MPAEDPEKLYQFKVKKINGEEVPLADFKGKTLLIVNTASKCGFTPQYGDLESLYKTYKEKGLVVLGFPANNFGWQEPGSNEEIKQFCDLRFKISFPLFEKIDVKGKNIHPLYKYLTEESPFKGGIQWNFCKFLVNGRGEVVARFGSTVKPSDKAFTDKVEAALSGAAA